MAITYVTDLPAIAFRRWHDAPGGTDDRLEDECGNSLCALLRDFAFKLTGQVLRQVLVTAFDRRPVAIGGRYE